MINYPDFLKNIQTYKPGKPVEEVKRELGLKEVIKLASNENPFGCSLSVKRAVEREAVNINFYPDGGAYYLREALSDFHSVEPDQIIFGNGSNEIIDMIGRVFLSDGSEALAFEGSFVVYKLVTEISGGIFREIPLECDLSRDLNKIFDYITERTKVIFIDNPCNPTGFANKKEEFESFLKDLPDNILLVLDEAYFEYAKEHGVPDGINYIRRINPDIPEKNIIVLRTFSKVYGLAGLRIGYGISNREIIEVLEKVRQPFNTNHLAQVAALEALKDQDFVRFSVEMNEKGKLQIYEGLERLDVHFIPSYGNFVMFKVDDGERVYKELMKKGVIVRPAFGFDNYLRVSIGREDQNKIFLEKLGEIISKC
ncbi:MAG TPA: histidinol-phosphate transaminase [Persephonella sp.]|uniref:Histidinol-phosphate aminotransferase n=1 Tax=Persephonella marina (strain DSM 14350 / EX-H1) TaxID=123214 RepID=C0QQF9_PERMH|nr:MULTISPECIES: histidinol-phosphate transaminase [Persephonella]ACO04759.1 histidinol-phosphate transaminase [Persephonella marina EX-H1]HCB69489.1 histidinol-phosphate transaminase [Persephonella sp.]